MTRTLHRWLVLTHRYLGIPLGAVFVVWFASGIVMMYTGDMPRLTPERRLAQRPRLDVTRVALAPAAAARSAHLSPSPRRALLLVSGHEEVSKSRRLSALAAGRSVSSRS